MTVLVVGYPEFRKITTKVENVLERSLIYYYKNKYGAYELYFNDGQWKYKCEILPIDIETFFGNEDNFRNDFILEYAVQLIGIE